MFQQTHQTARGKILLIAQMDNGHLLSTIGMIISWAERAGEQLHDIIARTHEGDRWGSNGNAIMAQVQRTLYALPQQLSLEEAIEQYGTGINTLAGRLEPYLLEAWTRALSEAEQASFDELRSRWRAVVGRDCALYHPERELLTAPVANPVIDQDDDDLPF